MCDHLIIALKFLANQQLGCDSLGSGSSTTKQVKDDVGGIFPTHLCHVLLCHLCICVHFRRALSLKQNGVFHICHHIGLHRSARCALNKWRSFEGSSRRTRIKKTPESLSVVWPKVTADFPQATVREGAVELTLRRGEEGTQRTFINTPNVKTLDGDLRWWMKIDTPAAKPSSKASKVRSGGGWTASTSKWTTWSTLLLVPRSEQDLLATE